MLASAFPNVSRLDLWSKVKSAFKLSAAGLLLGRGGEVGATERVEAGEAAVAVAEEGDADSFPVAALHGEGFAGREEGATVEAVEESVGVAEAVVLHT